MGEHEPGEWCVQHEWACRHRRRVAGRSAGRGGLRKGGFRGRLTLVGDEPYEPYDRPPLSKQVLTGRVAPESTALPQDSGLDAEWRLGTPAVGLDLAGKRVRLADGEELGFDRLLIATGTGPDPGPTRRRPRWTGWFIPNSNSIFVNELRDTTLNNRLREASASDPPARNAVLQRPKKTSNSSSEIYSITPWALMTS